MCPSWSRGSERRRFDLRDLIRAAREPIHDAALQREELLAMRPHDDARDHEPREMKDADERARDVDDAWHERPLARNELTARLHVAIRGRQGERDPRDGRR